MTLTLPTANDLYEFWGDTAFDVDLDRANLLIELGADLFWLATGLETDPLDSRLASLVRFAILDMAIYLFVTRENIIQEYSPYQSERIGSYSYSKEFNHTAAAITTRLPTNVPLFDKVVDYFYALAFDADGKGWANSKHVFSDRFVSVRREAWNELWGRWGFWQSPDGLTTAFL